MSADAELDAVRDMYADEKRATAAESGAAAGVNGNKDRRCKGRHHFFDFQPFVKLALPADFRCQCAAYAWGEYVLMPHSEVKPVPRKSKGAGA